MNKCVLPEVQLVVPGGGLVQQDSGFGVLLAPDVRAGVSVRVPARLQAEHITGNMVFAELAEEAEHLALAQLSRGAIPDAQSPERRQTPAAGEKVIALH